MKFVNRDNLRHLTGYGRDIALLLDDGLKEFDGSTAGAISALVKSRVSLLPCTVIVDADSASCKVQRRFNAFNDFDMQNGTQGVLLLILNVVNGQIHTTQVPLLSIISTEDITQSNLYQLYCHNYSNAFMQMDASEDNDRIAKVLGRDSLPSFGPLAYFGITKRGWRKRWSEHFAAAKRGSHYRFHDAIREWDSRARYVNHMVLASGLSETIAMRLEENAIDMYSLHPKGLNMVPGGNKGLAYLRSIGALGQSERVAPDDKFDIINRHFERTARAGIANPLAALNWLDPSYAERVICSAPGRLSPPQIRDARYLSSMGIDASDIVQRVGAKNVSQIQRLLTGATYSRVLERQ